MSKIYVYDPTISDDLSKVRGIGRYLQLLKENFPNECIFTNNLKEIPLNSIIVNPHFDVIKKPLMLKRISRREVAVIHDLIPIKYPQQYPLGIKARIYKLLNKLALKRYSTVITVSEASKADIVKLLKVPEKKVHVVYNILPQSFLKLKPVLPTTISLPNDYFVYVGDATWNKNIVNIAKAVKKANVSCIFVGKIFEKFLKQDPKSITHAELQEIKNFIIEVKGDKRFIFPGYIKDEELVYIYQHAIGNLFISRDEGFGYSFLEAASLKTPSILSDISVFHETAKDTALFVNPENIDDIAEKIHTLLKNRDLRNKLSVKAYERSKFFNSETFKSSYKDIVDNTLHYEI